MLGWGVMREASHGNVLFKVNVIKSLHPQPLRKERFPAC